MKNGRFSDAQIMAVLKQAEGGVPVSELCREHGMSSASFYKWRATVRTARREIHLIDYLVSCKFVK